MYTVNPQRKISSHWALLLGTYNQIRLGISAQNKSAHTFRLSMKTTVNNVEITQTLPFKSTCHTHCTAQITKTALSATRVAYSEGCGPLTLVIYSVYSTTCQSHTAIFSCSNQIVQSNNFCGMKTTGWEAHYFQMPCAK